jgi:carbon storage regulator
MNLTIFPILCPVGPSFADYPNNGFKCQSTPKEGPAMLVLSRRVGEEIIINDSIRVTIVAVKGDRVRIGIEAPRDVTVDRAEVHARRMHFVDVPVPVVAPRAVCDASVDLGGDLVTVCPGSETAIH